MFDTILGSTSNASQGAGAIGYGSSLVYAAGTAGAAIQSAVGASVTVQGAVGGNAAVDTAAFLAAIAACTNDQVVLVPPSPTGLAYLINQPLVLGQSAGARLLGIGKPQLTFSGIGSSTDCITMDGGSTKRQVTLENLIVDCGSGGQDGLALVSASRPIVRNVDIRNSNRDGFAIKCGNGQWVEKGYFDITLQSSGRHGLTLNTSGSDGAYINECVFHLFEVRGVSKITAGGNAIYVTSTASGAGSLFSGISFLHVEIDAQWATGATPAPSTSPILTDSGVAIFWNFYGGTIENTGTGVLSGPLWSVTGGTVSGITIQSTVTNSDWGNLSPSAAITKLQYNNISFGTQILQGIVNSPTNCRFSNYLTASQSNVTGDGTVCYVGSSGVTARYDRASNVSATGVFTAPVAGEYRFSVTVGLSGLLVAHTDALVGIRVGSGGSGGNYYLSETNPGVVKNTGNGLIMGGSICVTLAAGDTVWAIAVVLGSTKVVGITGGANNVSIFCGELLG